MTGWPGGGRSREPRVLDLVIVGCIFVIPQSFALWWHSSELGAPAAARLPFFAIPGALVGVRLLWPHRRAAALAEPIVVLLYALLVLNGLGMALARTAHPSNVISVYGQYAYWFLLVALMIRATAHLGGLYLLDMTRRYFLLVAATAWIFALVYAVFGDAIPYRMMYFTPPGDETVHVLGRNYYLTVAYSYHTVFGIEIPRFTFLYREPRVLGAHLVIGLVLQSAAWLQVRSGPDRLRLRELRNLVLIAGALVLTHSVYGYVLAACAAGLAVLPVLMREAYWRSFRPVNLLVLVLLLTGPMALAVAGSAAQNDLEGRVTSLIEQSGVDELLGKPAGIVGSYIAAYGAGPHAVTVFPLGTGIMNLDSPDFERRFGVTTLQGGTLLHVFIQSAGVMGLVIGALCIWRCLGYFARIGRATRSPEVRGGCLLGAYLIVVSTALFDLLFFHAYALLVLGALLGVRPNAETAGRAT